MYREARVFVPLFLDGTGENLNGNILKEIVGFGELDLLARASSS